jgi:2-iminobutanoate/2-iminopropanoate deaminase
LNQLITFDSSELLQANQLDVSALSLQAQLAEIFRLAAQTLAEDGLDLASVILIIVEVCDMKDRPIVNEAQKAIWKPENYPARIILERGGYKAGARVRLLFTATKAPHICVNSQKGHIPTGPFSRSAVVGDRVYGSGVRPICPETQKLVSGDLKEQSRQCLENLDTNMRASGTTLQKAYAFTIYLTDLANVGQVLAVFAEYGFSPDQVQMDFEKVTALNEYHAIEIACNALR